MDRREEKGKHLLYLQLPPPTPQSGKTSRVSLQHPLRDVATRVSLEGTLGHGLRALFTLARRSPKEPVENAGPSTFCFIVSVDNLDNCILKDLLRLQEYINWLTLIMSLLQSDYWIFSIAASRCFLEPFLRLFQCGKVTVSSRSFPLKECLTA